MLTILFQNSSKGNDVKVSVAAYLRVLIAAVTAYESVATIEELPTGPNIS